MSDFAFNVWGAVASAIGVLTLVPTFMYLFLCRMPSSKYRVLKVALEEVEKNFNDGLQQGLIRPEHDLHRLYNWLWSIQVRFDDITDEVDNIKSWRDELAYWYGGFSSRITFVYDDVIELRKLIARRSSRERRALVAAGIASRLAEISSKREHFSYIGSGVMLHLPTREQSMDLPRYHPSPPSSESYRATASTRVSAVASSSPEPPAYNQMHAPSPSSAHSDIVNPAARAMPQTYDCCGVTSQGRRHLDWDADLTELLSAVLIHACRADKGKHDNQLRREMLRRFGTQLLEGLDAPCDAGAGVPAKRDGAVHCHTSTAIGSDGSQKDTVGRGEHE